jgi:hypothetical protein
MPYSTGSIRNIKKWQLLRQFYAASCRSTIVLFYTKLSLTLYILSKDKIFRARLCPGDKPLVSNRRLLTLVNKLCLFTQHYFNLGLRISA